MLDAVAKTKWCDYHHPHLLIVRVPSFVQERRFANWIANAQDWNVSRNRYWGTPLPIWVSEDYSEVCVHYTSN
jgi:isoleucyl-tRNA synthetase